MNRAIGILNRAESPTAFVMFGGLKLSTRRSQMLQCATHMRLFRAHGVYAKSRNGQ
jgi:hypothetical protein